MPELKTLKDGEVQILPKTKTEAIIFDTPIEEISKESREIKEELKTINGESIADIGQGLSKLIDVKKNLMTAIQDNNIQIDKATPFDQYAEKISQITAGEPEVTYSVSLFLGHTSSCAIYGSPEYIGNYKPGETVEIWADSEGDDTVIGECPLNNVNLLESRYDSSKNKFYFKFIMPAYNTIISMKLRPT